LRKADKKIGEISLASAGVARERDRDGTVVEVEVEVERLVEDEEGP
jgi:hypothetical protein